MDAADEEAAHRISIGLSSKDVDMPAYQHLLNISNIMIRTVLRKLVTQSIRTYTNLVTASAERVISQPLFFTNLEEADGNILFNPPLEKFTERIIATIVYTVEAVNKTKGLAMTPVRANMHHLSMLHVKPSQTDI